jgi:hypothetical protein
LLRNIEFGNPWWAAKIPGLQEHSIPKSFSPGIRRRETVQPAPGVEAAPFVILFALGFRLLRIRLAGEQFGLQDRRASPFAGSGADQAHHFQALNGLARHVDPLGV